MTRLVALAGTVLVAAAGPASASPITHRPGDKVPPLVVSPDGGPPAAGGTVGAGFTAFGVDYTFGGAEAIFLDEIDDPADGATALAFAGVNGTGTLDLLTAVDGRVVVPGSTAQGLTRFLSAEAGVSAPGRLFLEVFDADGRLLASAANDLPLGSTGRTTFAITRPTADVAAFRISSPSRDRFGVTGVTLESPVAAGADPLTVPEPASLAVCGVLAAVGVAAGRRRGS